MLKIEVELKDQIVWIHIDGEIDASSSLQLDECLNEQVKSKSPGIAIDCTQLSYISSAGLGVFMSYIEDLKENNQRMVLFGLNEKVKNVFEMLGLDQLMNLLQTKEEAIQVLNEK